MYIPSRVTQSSASESSTILMQENYIRNLYGQKLYCKPYNFEGKDCSVNTESPGRCILNECIFETYYRQRGDIPLDKIFSLYHHPKHSLSNCSSKADENKVEDRKNITRPDGPIRNSIEPTRNLIGYGIELMHQRQQQKQIDHNDSTLNSYSEADNALIEFLQYYAKVPEWVNPKQIARGQEILTTYLPAIGATLYYRSLVPGFSIPKIAAVLLSTGYLAPPASQSQVQNRLLDTGAFIAAISALVVEAPNTIRSDTSTPLLEPYSEIWQTILQVRVLHAKVRYALLKRDNTKRWNINEFGIPINQEDLAATLLAFSYNTLLGIEFILGCPISTSDQLDYLHFWRYVGWLLGIETIHDTAYIATLQDGNNLEAIKYPPLDPCGPGWIASRPNPLEHSYSMFASILLHLSKPDSTSVTVAQHLLQLGGRSSDPSTALEKLRTSNDVNKREDVPKKNTMWYYFRSYQCRRFVGHELANALLLPLHPKWYKRWELHTYSTMYLLFLRLYTWVSVPRSPFRSMIFKWHQKHLTQFFKNWKSKFAKSSSSLSVATNDDNHPDDMYNDILGGGVSSCPFAMVAPPKY
jgi:ER-bound oxygenase mpaB/B'/Rubber oxygenase, catalytic domain